jgi:hypothetical protein
MTTTLTELKKKTLAQPLAGVAKCAFLKPGNLPAI